VCLVRGAHREAAQPAGRRDGDGELRHGASSRRLRPDEGGARSAGRRGPGHRLRRDAPGAGAGGRARRPRAGARCSLARDARRSRSRGARRRRRPRPPPRADRPGRAPAAAPRLGRAHGPGPAHGHGPGLAGAGLAMAVPGPDHPRRDVGGLALPPCRVDQPPPRRGDDGHAHLARRAGRVRLVALGVAVRRRRRARHDDAVLADEPSRGGERPPVPRGRVDGDGAPPHRALPRVPSHPPRRCRAARPDGPRRQGRRRAGSGRPRAPHPHHRARRGGPVRRPPGREGGHRWRGRGRLLSGGRIHADGRERARRGRAG
jgi:hypothetical protein